MDKVQTSHRRMFTNTQATMDANSAIWNGVPINVNVKNQFDELLQRIDETNERTNPSSKTVTAGKEELRINLADKVVGIAGILQAFAAFNGDNVLLGKVKLTKSDIYNARETDVEMLVNPVIDEARNHLADLIDFTLTEEMIVEVETTVDDYKAQIGQPRFIRNQAFAAMTVLAELIDTTNELLKNKLDKLMIRYAGTHPEFYDEYLRSRTIVD
jgi:hypothetical protein